MDANTPLWKAHDISQQLQDKIEVLPNVERAFVHVDHETTHAPVRTLFALPPLTHIHILSHRNTGSTFDAILQWNTNTICDCDHHWMPNYTPSMSTIRSIGYLRPRRHAFTGSFFLRVFFLLHPSMQYIKRNKYFGPFSLFLDFVRIEF
jgi:hypothetical protein